MKNKDNLEKRKKNVLKAATKIFFSKGYRLATLDEVASEAGYSKRTVYLDFKNKDDLFISVASDGLEMLLNKLRKIPLGKLPIEEYIDQYVKTIAEFSHEHSKYFHMFIADSTQEMLKNCSSETRNRAAQIEIAGFGLLAQEVERAIQEGLIPSSDAWEVAGILIGSVVGIIMLSRGSQVVYKKSTLVDRVIKTGRLICKSLFIKQSKKDPITKKK